MRNLKEIELFRIIHIDNIPHILKHGITHKNSKNANPKYINIGDDALISCREKKKVDITNGGDSKPKTIILGEFIPFYFGVRMPMLYVIQNSGGITSNLVYLVCNLYELIKLDREYYFSDGHPTNKITIFYDYNYINQIENILDWEAINATYWGREENLEIKRKMQAEFLIKGDLPLSVIKRYICYNEESKNRLINFGIDPDKIEINGESYY